MVRLQRLVLPRAYEAVSKALEEAIITGRLAAGETLPTENELAEQFGVNRHTVREGIRVLEENGFVQRQAGRRLHVTIPDYTALAPRATRALLMQQVTFRELWEVAVQLEVLAADLAFERGGPELIESLEDNAQQMEVALKEGRPIVELDIAFHTLIAEATKNRVLLLAREPVSLLFYPSLQRLFEHKLTRDVSPQRLLEAHRRLIRGFIERDGEYVHNWMKKHMVDFRRGYEVAGISLDEIASSVHNDNQS